MLLTELKSTEPIGEATQPEPPTTKAPDISIHDAARDGNIEGVKQHLDLGVDVNGKNKYGSTPLRLAAGEGHKEFVELLISEDANLNAKDIDGETPLHRASERKQTKIIELLIAKDSDVNAVGKHETPLDFPIRVKHPEVVNLLRKHGAKTGKEMKTEGQ